MPTVCESCGRLNRTQAMFCSGCLQQLPAFAPSGPSALETLRRKTAEISARDDAARLSRARVAELRFPYWLPALILTLCAGFISWYAAVPHARTGTLPPAPARVVEAAPGPARLPDAIASALPAQVPLSKAAQSGQSDDAAPGAAAPETAPSPNESPASQTVAAFYRALSNGDGRTAVAAVTPTKRGTGGISSGRHVALLRLSARAPGDRVSGDGGAQPRAGTLCLSRQSRMVPNDSDDRNRSHRPGDLHPQHQGTLLMPADRHGLAARVDKAPLAAPCCPSHTPSRRMSSARLAPSSDLPCATIWPRSMR